MQRAIHTRDYLQRFRRQVLLALFVASSTQAQVTLSEGTNLAADVSPSKQQIAMDLLGSIWVLDADGGEARIVTDGLLPAKRPRWSPDGTRILYQTTSARGSQVWLLNVADGVTTRLDDGSWFDQQADWHRGRRGTKRVVFSSERGNTGLDLWEVDLATGRSRRLTHGPGDETEPAWSPDGKDLAYIRHENDQWRLILKPRGRAEEVLFVSDEPLAAPAWRPDGTLLTFLRRDQGAYVLDMAILSDPPLVRPLAEGEDFFLAPVSWLDRDRFVYTADGLIKSRNINTWEADEVPFQATIGRPAERSAAAEPAPRELPVVDAPDHRRVIRAARLFDGVTPGYRTNMDVLIDGGKIAAVEPRHEWQDAVVLDLGDVTILPGFIDIYSSLPAGSQRAAGLKLLAFGVTTVVANGSSRHYDPKLWASAESPGPRLLRWEPLSRDADQSPEPALVTLPVSGTASSVDRDAIEHWRKRGIPVLAESWVTGFRSGADLLLGADTLPTSPLGKRYQDVDMALSAGPVTLVSGLADAGTPGLMPLIHSRQGQLIEQTIDLARRHSGTPNLAAARSTVVLGSKPNGLPAGLALQAELRALAAAGLSGDQVLWSAGRNAARALGLTGEIGRVAPGALADLVLVRGDPRKRIADALNIVAVVRNGRFYSLIGLLERAENVE